MLGERGSCMGSVSGGRERRVDVRDEERKSRCYRETEEGRGDGRRSCWQVHAVAHVKNLRGRRGERSFFFEEGEGRGNRCVSQEIRNAICQKKVCRFALRPLSLPYVSRFFVGLHIVFFGEGGSNMIQMCVVSELHFGHNLIHIRLYRRQAQLGGLAATDWRAPPVPECDPSMRLTTIPLCPSWHQTRPRSNNSTEVRQEVFRFLRLTVVLWALLL